MSSPLLNFVLFLSLLLPTRQEETLGDAMLDVLEDDNGDIDEEDGGDLDDDKDIYKLNLKIVIIYTS